VTGENVATSLFKWEPLSRRNIAMKENKAINAVSIAMYVAGEPPEIRPLLQSTSATPTEIMPRTASSTLFLALDSPPVQGRSV